MLVVHDKSINKSQLSCVWMLPNILKYLYLLILREQEVKDKYISILTGFAGYKYLCFSIRYLVSDLSLCDQCDMCRVQTG